jgi:uncharacterized protein (TIGR02145 family)
VLINSIAKYADGSYKADTLDIEFIGTNTAGYGELNGVKYLTLKSGTSGTLKVALTNLGGNENNDAGDLGDFYQWGRVADGHQHVVWKKGTDHRDSIVPMIGGANNTSAVIAYSAIAGSNATSATANYQTAAKSGDVTPFHQVLNTSDGYGKFIYANITASEGYYQWYNPNRNTSVNDNYLWGQSNQSATSRSPVKNGNDPCPSGWKVPSRWLFSDLYNNAGTSDPNSTTSWAGGTNNAWKFRDASSTYAVGGAVITNASGEKLFLPAAGGRDFSNGALYSIGNSGNYWSSTYGTSLSYSYYLTFLSSDVHAGNGYNPKASGFSVRCVAAE